MGAWEPLAFEDPRGAAALARLDTDLGERVCYRLPEGFSPYDEAMREEILELQARVLQAFRALVPEGERLLVVDPDEHHVPFLFDPHVPFESEGSLDARWGYKPYVKPVWTVGLLPDGDSACFVGPDFIWEARYLVGSAPDELIIQGTRLCAALERPPPRLLQRFERVATIESPT